MDSCNHNIYIENSLLKPFQNSNLIHNENSENNSHMPDYTRCFPLFLSLHLFRSWRTDLYKGSCALICVSVDHEDSPRMGAVRRVVLESQYLLEPCGTGRTRLTHISRVDLRCGQTSSVLIVEA